MMWVAVSRADGEVQCHVLGHSKACAMNQALIRLSSGKGKWTIRRVTVTDAKTGKGWKS